MNVRNRCLSLMACFALAFPLLMGPGYAWAAAVGTVPSELNPVGQAFYGDGAVYGSGYLQAPALNPSGDRCLECHQAGGPALDMSSYLRTGHGNMLKKVTAPPQIWKGANTVPYPTDASGHPIDWATGTVNLGGWCDIGGFEGQFEQDVCEATTGCTLDASNYPRSYTTQGACEGASGTWKVGTWTPGSRPVTIISFIGDWMSVDAPDTGISGGDLPANKYFMADGRTYGTCGSCHNAGYKANDYGRIQPFADFPSFPTTSAAGVGGSWVLNGIQCERCHDATQHYADPFTATVPRGASSTAVCSQCHIRTAAWEGSANPNAATQPTAYPIGASATNFGSHLIGKQVLNSPHGKFTGPYAKIATTTEGLYNSSFSPDGISQGGCDTCHDVHQSTVPEAKVNFTQEPIRRECDLCHATEAGSNLAGHPSGAGTPFPNGTGVAAACVACHMPKPAGGTGLNAHVFRINTDPDYSTFPKQVGGVWTPGYCSDPTYTTRDTCVAASKAWSGVASSSPDGTFTDAVWVDLDLACGQCHGAAGTAHLMPKGLIAAYAQGMHAGGGSMSATCSDCHSATAAVHPAGTGTPAQCSDCHGTTRAGVKPTVESACLTCHGSTGTASHQFTAEQIAEYADGVHAGSSMPSTTCTDCHAKISTDLINHNRKTCTDCHETTAGAKPGVKPTSAQACNDCHAGSLSPTALAKRAANIHKNVAPVASMDLVAEDSDPVLAGIQVKIGATVQVVDTSTDRNENLSWIKVNWGDTLTWSITDFVSPGETASHSYGIKGKKVITLTAFDLKGLKSTVKRTIIVVK